MPEKPEIIKDEYLKLLDSLRESGDTNMFGAAIYLKEAFPELKKSEAQEILIYWMETFSERKENS